MPCRQQFRAIIAINEHRKNMLIWNQVFKHEICAFHIISKSKPNFLGLTP